jgi:hypothetical protein
MYTGMLIGATPYEAGSKYSTGISSGQNLLAENLTKLVVDFTDSAKKSLNWIRK